jgi:hypothetical protein
METLEYFAQIVKGAIAKDGARDANIAKFRKILACDWEAPEELSALDWWADKVTSTPADGVDAAIRAFATNLPNLTLYPSTPTDEERERIEAVEDALRWHFMLSNQRSVNRPVEVSLESVLSVGGIAAEVVYIPYMYRKELKHQKDEIEADYKKRTKRIRAMRKNGDFVYPFHPLEYVHPTYSAELLESVSLAIVMTIDEIEKKFGKDNPGVKKMVKKLDSDKEFKGADKRAFYCSYYEYIDYDYRVRFAKMTNSQTVDKEVSGDLIEIEREEHGLDWIPWSFRECRKPLLQTVVDSGSYESQNELMSMYFAMMKAVVAHPYLVSHTADGKAPDFDYTQPGGVIPMGMGGQGIDALPPRQTDPNLPAQIQRGDAELGQQVNTRALTALSDLASSTPYATINAILQATMSSLSDKRLVAEAFWEDVFTQELRWINYSGETLVGRRTKSRKNAEYENILARFSEVRIGNDPLSTVMVDPDTVVLKVRLREDTPVDKQTRLNSAIMLHRDAPLSWQSCFESFGLSDDLDVNEAEWMQEQFTVAKVQAEANRIMQESDIQLREQIKAEVVKQMEQEAAQQGAPPQEMSVQNEQNALAAGEQFPEGMPGGSTQAMSAPGMTREMVSGQTQAGEDVMR